MGRKGLWMLAGAGIVLAVVIAIGAGNHGIRGGETKTAGVVTLSRLDAPRIWLERLDDGDNENWYVWQRPLGDDPYTLAGWALRRDTGDTAEPWDLNGAYFARCCTYAQEVAYDDSGLTIHDATTGGTWAQSTVLGEDYNACAPSAGYDAATDPAYIEFVVPAGIRAVAVQFLASQDGGVITVTIDGATALVNGDYLGSDGTLDTYKSANSSTFGGRFVYAALIARDLPTDAAHTLRITVTGLDSHASGKDDVYIGKIWTITRPGRPGGTNVAWADVKTFQGGLWTDSSMLASIRETDETAYGGWAHENLTNQSLDTITLDGVDRSSDTTGTITEGYEAYIEYTYDMDPGADKLADVTAKLRWRANYLLIDLSLTFAQDYVGTGQWAYGPQFCVGYCADQTAYQYPWNFWRGGYHDWGPGTTRVGAKTANDPSTTPRQMRMWLPGVFGVVYRVPYMLPAAILDVKRTASKDYWEWPVTASNGDTWAYRAEIELYGDHPNLFSNYVKD